MPNFHVGTTSASAPTNALAGTSSSTIVAQKLNRVGLVITNISGGTIYLGLAGNAAVLQAGISLVANGGVWVMDEFNFNNEAVTAIAHTAGSIVAIQEFYT